MSKPAKICVIGAGPSGITVAKNLLQAGLSDVTVYEQKSEVGGNWLYDPSSGHSSVYKTTHLITSKNLSAYDDFPMPADYPDYPSHGQMLDYFQAYARHFSVYPVIQFNTKVVSITRDEAGKWLISIVNAQGQSTEIFDELIVANGHHWNPNLPSYQGEFSGELIHSHDYKTADSFSGKRVLVVGGGNSGCDIAVEISRVASECSISLRRGYHIFPKFMFGKPTDVALFKLNPLPRWLRQRIIKLALRIVQGRYDKYKLQKPTSKPLETHPTLNTELLYFIRHGKVKPRIGIDHFSGNTVHFTDGSQSDFDVVIFATGYRISFPFFAKDFIDFSDLTQVPLYKKMLHPDYSHLYFVGLLQPLGAIWPLADYQAQLIAKLIKGEVARPNNLSDLIVNDLNKPHYNYQKAHRHAVQVDYCFYRRELEELMA